MNIIYVKEKLLSFLKEDLGIAGDITSESVGDFSVNCYLEARQDIVLAGSCFFELIFKILDNGAEFSWNLKDGDKVNSGERICTFRVNAKAALFGERTALNLMQRLSGISTLTREYVNLLEGTSIKLLDTRKTTPGLRYFEKYATRIGGAYNHRFGLYDAVMVKDNHIKIYGSLTKAVEMLRNSIPVTSKIEVELENWQQLKEAVSIARYIDILMLDNWEFEEAEQAVSYLRKELGRDIMIEISGRMDKEKIEIYRNLDIDFISTSRLITEAKWVDIGMEVE